MKKFINLKTLIVLLLIVLAFFLRFYKIYERTSFDADQEWLAFRAKEILSGDLALLGQVTSVGNFSIGPGYVYLVSLTSLIFANNPIAGAILSVTLGTVTLLVIFLFTNKFIDEKVSLILLFLTSISFNLITWDQTPWAPSLFYLSQLILLTGVYLSLKNEVGYLILTLGFILGFQSHFGIFLSLLSILIYFILVRPVRLKTKTLFFALLILLIGLLPNIIFDLTHNFSNFRKLFEIIQGSQTHYYLSFGKIINYLGYNSVSLIYPRQINLFDSIVVKSLFALVLANCISFLKDKKLSKLALLLLITVIFPALFFYIEQGKFSEYYLMMTVPSLILMLGLFLKRIIEKKYLLILILIVATYLNFKAWYLYKKSWSLKSKMDVTEYIVNKAGNNNYGISLSIRKGDEFGFKYLFDYYGVLADVPPKKGETKIFSIIIPEGFDGMKGMKNFDGIGLIWQGVE